MPKSVLLLGAGASMDAGVPGAYALTEEIHGNLSLRQVEEAKLFAFIHSKLVTRRVRQGGSPFGPIGVEEVYDALRRFLDRGKDPMSEFVSSWDDEVASDKFDERAFEAALKQSISTKVASVTNGRRIHFERDLYRGVSKPLARAFRGAGPDSDLENSLAPYTNALAQCLAPKVAKPKYISDLVAFAAENIEVIGTLNYDMLLEDACDHRRYSYNYGLSHWNERKIIRYDSANLKIAKLHGSLNWTEEGDDILLDQEVGYRSKRGLIFGGESQKLVPYGPYLQLRSTFEKRLRASTRMGIIGYSFQDAHMNAMLRLWVATKRRAKLVIMNPSLPQQSINELGRWFDTDREGVSRYRIEVVHIARGAKAGMKQFISEMSDEPAPPSADVSDMGIRVVS